MSMARGRAVDQQPGRKLTPTVSTMRTGDAPQLTATAPGPMLRQLHGAAVISILPRLFPFTAKACEPGFIPFAKSRNAVTAR
jgi:hypothetical protein